MATESFDAHDDVVDAVGHATTSLQRTASEPKGLRGWLLGFLLTLAAAIVVYSVLAYILLSVMGLFSLFGLIGLTQVIVPGLALYALLLKRREGIAIARAFLILNAFYWVFWCWVVGTIVPGLTLASIYGIGSWLYLDLSKRVKNTFGPDQIC